MPKAESRDSMFGILSQNFPLLSVAVRSKVMGRIESSNRNSCTLHGVFWWLGGFSPHSSHSQIFARYRVQASPRRLESITFVPVGGFVRQDCRRSAEQAQWLFRSDYPGLRNNSDLQSASKQRRHCSALAGTSQSLRDYAEVGLRFDRHHAASMQSQIVYQ